MSLRDWYHNARGTWATGFRVWVICSLILIIALYVVWRALEPAPPLKITIAAGVEGGSYDYFAKKYADYFRRNGFELEIRHTAGSVENYALLKDDNSGVDVAIVQGGTTPDWAPEKLQAVCSIYFEPLWVFYRDQRPVTGLSQFRGKRLAMGAEGSGSRSLAIRLLAENRLKETDVQVSDLTGIPAADALIAGQVDAVFLVISPGSPAVQKLLRAEGVKLMSFDQADAYARRNQFLSRVTLYRGVMDLGAGIPAEDIQLVSPAAMLVARHSVHTGTLELLVRAAKATHSGGSTLADPNTFPSANLTDLPVGRDAQYYLRSQPSRLLGGLPFWLKSLIDRLVFLIIPLIAILVPLMRFAPVLFRWSVRSRIVRYYKRLEDVESHLEANADHNTLQGDLEALDKLAHKLATMTIPAGYMPDLYDLRAHLDRVKMRVKGKLA